MDIAPGEGLRFQLNDVASDVTLEWNGIQRNSGKHDLNDTAVLNKPSFKSARNKNFAKSSYSRLALDRKSAFRSYVGLWHGIALLAIGLKWFFRLFLGHRMLF